MQYPHPIHLSASVVLNPKAQGIAPNTVALKNPSPDLPMEIHEITWDTYSSSNIYGGAVACSLFLGDIPITNGYVPIWNFGKSKDSLRTVGNPSQMRNTVMASFSWRLPHPIFVPPGAVLQPMFQHRGFNAATITTWINYRGAVLPKGTRPSQIFIPYVSAYSSKPFTLNVASTDQSQEADIANPFKTPLLLQHMIGRVGVTSDTVNYSELWNPDFGARLLRVRIIDSHGRPIVRDLSYFSQVFWRQTRAWHCGGTQMDPGDYYNVYLASQVLNSSVGASQYAIADVSAVSWRAA